MRENIVYMLLRLKQKSTRARYGLAQPTFRDDAGARQGRSALPLWRPGASSRVQLRSAKSLITLLSGDRRCWMIPPVELKAGDILLLSGNPRHVLHDGSGAPPVPCEIAQTSI